MKYLLCGASYQMAIRILRLDSRCECGIRLKQLICTAIKVRNEFRIVIVYLCSRNEWTN